MPPAKRAAAPAKPPVTLETLAEEITALRGLLEPKGVTTYDAEGWVRSGQVYVESTRQGDLITSGTMGARMIPIVYRVVGDSLRNEYGAVIPQGTLPKPWRLIWRDPAHILDPDGPKDPKKRKRGEPDDDV